jgi:hypothetical protein
MSTAVETIGPGYGFWGLIGHLLLMRIFAWANTDEDRTFQVCACYIVRHWPAYKKACRARGWD